MSFNFFNKYYQANLKQSIETSPINELSGKKVLLTGSTGLIGSYLVDLIFYFNMTTKTKITLTCINRNNLNVKERFSYIDNNEIDFKSCGIEEYIPAQKYDYIIHAASLADPINYARFPVETITANVLGTISLLNLAKQSDSEFLFVSSREVYGYIKDSSHYREIDYGLIDFNNLRASYPESKRICELLCRSYGDEYNIKTKVVRLGYVYGPTQTKTDSRAVAQFLRNSVNGEDIVLKSLGTQKRSYTYVSDCVRGILYVLMHGKKSVYNIADEKSEITVAELASLIANVVGKKVISARQNEEEKKGSSDMHDALLSCSELHELGWKCLYDLSTGIRETIKVML